MSCSRCSTIKLPDNTGGATHYYAPKQMPNGQAPDWALGEQGRMVGNQIFYRLPLTVKNTANSIIQAVTGAPSGSGFDRRDRRFHLWR